MKHLSHRPLSSNATFAQPGPLNGAASQRYASYTVHWLRQIAGVLRLAHDSNSRTTSSQDATARSLERPRVVIQISTSIWRSVALGGRFWA